MLGKGKNVAETIDAYADDRHRIMVFRKIALVLIALGAVLAIALAVRGVELLSLWSALAAVLLVAGLPFAYWADEIERKHDLETASEVEAFMNGASPEDIERVRDGSKAKRRIMRTLPAIGVATAFLIVVLAVALMLV